MTDIKINCTHCKIETSWRSIQICDDCFERESMKHMNYVESEGMVKSIKELPKSTTSSGEYDSK